mmetsp:Transcript_33638/g.68311  ORF Transcript_33638/g.68311 Transcript_33638/m.68311 type:complete len:93 (+) Transcript_33638:1667-1945(+)
MSTPSIAIALMALTFTFLRRRGEEHVSPSQVTHEVELMVSTEFTFLVKKEVSDDVGDELSLSLSSSGETDDSSSATEATTRPSRKDCRRRSR